MDHSASGKSTLAQAIAKKFKLPTIHLDVHYWQPKWQKPDEHVWRKVVNDLLKAESWVMDGNFPDTFDLRLPQADRIILVNMPRTIALWRSLGRLFSNNKNTRRPDMPTGCDESVDFSLYKYIWKFNAETLPLIISAIKNLTVKKKQFIFLVQKTWICYLGV